VDNQSAIEHYMGPRHWAGHCQEYEYDEKGCRVEIIPKCLKPYLSIK